MATQVRLLVEGGAPKGGMDLGSGTELPAEIRRLLQDSKEATQEEEVKKVKKKHVQLMFFPRECNMPHLQSRKSGADLPGGRRRKGRRGLRRRRARGKMRGPLKSPSGRGYAPQRHAPLSRKEL